MDGGELRLNEELFENNGIVFEFFLNLTVKNVNESIDNEDESSKNGAIRHPSALFVRDSVR